MNARNTVIRIIAAVFLLTVLVFSTDSVYATVAIEQQINIIDQEYLSIGTTEPTDNQLGLIKWEESKYNGETVYFEAIIRCDTCSGGNNQVTAGLYSAAGTLVTNSSVSTGNGTYSLVRSSAITANLTDSTDYSVRITRDATAGTAYIKAARIIILQSATSITDSQTQVELGNASTTGNTAYALINSPKLLRYDTVNYAPLPTIYFEATIKSSDSSTAYAVLTSSADCSSNVSGSEVSVSGTTWTRVRSSSISLNSGSSYFVCAKASSGQTASIANAKLILDQSNSLGITNLETYHQMINTHASHSNSTYTSQEFANEFNPAHFAGARFNYYFESTLNSAGDTGYAVLYNRSDTSAIDNSEIYTNDSSYSRIRSGEISADLPTATKFLDTQIANSGTSATHLSSSWLVIQMHAYPQFSFEIEGVAGGTSTNGITTSVASQADGLDFKTLTTGTPKYLAHRLTTATNAASGYTITMKLINTLQGNYPANIIESFPGSWASPQAWTEPTGTSANVNTGWIGANTSDTRISGWSSGSGLFGPVGTTSQKVMESIGVDTGSSIYVTFALEVNQFQPTDVYLGTLRYDITPTY